SAPPSTWAGWRGPGSWRSRLRGRAGAAAGVRQGAGGWQRTRLLGRIAALMLRDAHPRGDRRFEVLQVLMPPAPP
ncbi:MAG: hypothetical protein WEA24_02005, partial [Gemmatimonadota bacterium]